MPGVPWPGWPLASPTGAFGDAGFPRVLFFVDETWQMVGEDQVGALGGVGIAQTRYSDFAKDVFGLKRELLEAAELNQHERGGHRCLSKNQFRRKADGREAKWLDAADWFFELLARHHVKIFVIWTTTPELLTLRNPATTALTKPYKQLLFDFRAYMEREAPRQLASLNFDQRGRREDEATACALTNYLIRTQGRWGEHFIQIPELHGQFGQPRSSSG